MGTIRPTFQSEGNLPVDIKLLNNVVSCGAMLIAVIFPEIPSLPTDLVTSSLIIPHMHLLQYTTILRGSL